MLGFNGGLPGPEVRMRQGQTARITLDNRLEEGALVHWHGLRVPNRMDGVNVLTQDVVIPGDSYRYQFGVPDAGHVLVSLALPVLRSGQPRSFRRLHRRGAKCAGCRP